MILCVLVLWLEGFAVAGPSVVTSDEFEAVGENVDLLGTVFGFGEVDEANVVVVLFFAIRIGETEGGPVYLVVQSGGSCDRVGAAGTTCYPRFLMGKCRCSNRRISSFVLIVEGVNFFQTGVGVLSEDELHDEI